MTILLYFSFNTFPTFCLHLCSVLVLIESVRALPGPLPGHAMGLEPVEGLYAPALGPRAGLFVWGGARGPPGDPGRFPGRLPMGGSALPAVP